MAATCTCISTHAFRLTPSHYHTLAPSHPHTYTDISPPVSTRLTISDVYDENGKPSPAVLKKHFTNEGRVDEDVALRIISEGTCILSYTEIYQVILKFTKFTEIYKVILRYMYTV